MLKLVLLNCASRITTQVEERAASRLEARLKPLETTLETLTAQVKKRI